MGNLITDLLIGAPTWVQWAVYIIIILGILSIFVLLVVGAYKFSIAVTKETRVFDLSKENNRLLTANKNYEHQFEEINNSLEALNLYTYTTTKEIRTLFLESLSTIDQEEKLVERFNENTAEYIHYFISVICTDIGNSRKRVSLWRLDDDNPYSLLSIYRSSNFAVSNSKRLKLNLNSSIAGRALRTLETQTVLDLENDPDWKRFSSFHEYVAILAIPISDNRVLTIDYKNKPDKFETMLIQNAANYLSLFYAYTEDVEDYIELLDIL